MGTAAPVAEATELRSGRADEGVRLYVVGSAARSRDAPRVCIPLQPLQLRPHLGSMLITQVAVFLQPAIDDVFQPGRDLAIETDQGGRIRIEYRFENKAGGSAVKRQSPGGHLIQHRPEGKQIGSCIQFLAAYLLRRHIGDGS